MNSIELRCFTEGLQIDKAGLSTKIQSQTDKINWRDSGLQGGTMHFMCALLGKRDLVTNQGHERWAEHRI